MDEKPQASNAEAPTTRVSWREKSLALALAAVIFLPFAYASLIGQLPEQIPWQLHGFWEFSSLFSHRLRSWPSNHVLVKDSSGRWREVPHGPPFHHNLYGRMTRLDLLIMNFVMRNGPNEWDDPETSKQKRMVLEKVCRAYRECYDHPEAAGAADTSANPIKSPIQAVRLLRVWRPVSNDGPPKAPWPVTLPSDWDLENELSWDLDHETLFELSWESSSRPIRPFGL